MRMLVCVCVLQYLASMEEYENFADAMISVKAAEEAAAVPVAASEPPAVLWEYRTPGGGNASDAITLSCDGIQWSSL